MDLASVSDEDLIASLPRGVRSNNPLNLKDMAGQFRSFPTMDDGIAAADQNLLAYKTKHGIDTINGVVGRWAPAGADGNDPAAYAAHVAKVTGIAPDARIDLADPSTRHALLSAMGEHENGAAVVPTQKADLSGVSDAELLASLGKAKAPPMLPAPVTAAKPARKDQVLGFEKGLVKPLDNAAAAMAYGAHKIGLDKPINAVADALGLPTDTQHAADQHADYFAKQRAAGVEPGRLGEFGGNVLGTALLTRGMSPLVSGAVSGAALSDKKDLGGVTKDAAIGGVAGRATAALSDAAQIGLRKLLSKAPQIMDLPALEGAVKAAYAKVDASGFKIPTVDMRGLANDVTGFLRDKGGPKAARLYADSDAFASRLHALSTQKGGVSVSQLDELRSDIYEALIKPGGKEAGIGKAIRGKIDGLIDAIPNEDIKAARGLYARLSKFRTVANKLDSADLRKSAAYSGTNTDNTIRQQLRPLTDPTSGQRIRNASADETDAVRRVVGGTFVQNRARDASHLLDPRRLMSMPASALSGSTALATHGLSLIPQLAGLAGTVTANRASQKNVQALLSLIAAGGSKQALARVPTQASLRAEQVVAALRPLMVGASAPALAAARRDPKAQPKR
jgi:hypothetical protein